MVGYIMKKSRMPMGMEICPNLSESRYSPTPGAYLPSRSPMAMHAAIQTVRYFSRMPSLASFSGVSMHAPFPYQEREYIDIFIVIVMFPGWGFDALEWSILDVVRGFGLPYAIERPFSLLFSLDEANGFKYL
jgi:hypothetical protein